MGDDRHRLVSDAARAFESRWTLRALKRTDPGLHARFVGQQLMFDQALVTGDETDIEAQAEAMCRGWHAVARRMEEAGAEDDACVFGFDARSGLRVAIGDQVACRERVRDIHGDKVIWLTPDECATLLAAQQELLKIKGAFLGAEVIDLYPTEPKVDAP